MKREIELRACCGKLRWALLEAIEPLPEATTISAIRWGPALIPLNLSNASAPLPDLVDTIMAKTDRWLGGKTHCYTGRGALVIASDQVVDATQNR